jgi:hypothetical protein
MPPENRDHATLDRQTAGAAARQNRNSTHARHSSQQGRAKIGKHRTEFRSPPLATVKNQDDIRQDWGQGQVIEIRLPAISGYDPLVSCAGDLATTVGAGLSADRNGRSIAGAP